MSTDPKPAPRKAKRNRDSANGNETHFWMRCAGRKVKGIRKANSYTARVAGHPTVKPTARSVPELEAKILYELEAIDEKRRVEELLEHLRNKQPHGKTMPDGTSQ